MRFSIYFCFVQSPEEQKAHNKEDKEPVSYMFLFSLFKFVVCLTSASEDAVYMSS